MPVIKVCMGSNPSSDHVVLLNMQWWIWEGKIYAYHNEGNSFDWYTNVLRRAERSGDDNKDLQMTITEYTKQPELCTVDWIWDEGNYMTFNKRHLIYLFHCNGVCLNGLIMIQRHARRRIMRRVINSRIISNISAFRRALSYKLPEEIMDIITKSLMISFDTLKFNKSHPVILVETNAFKQRCGIEGHVE